MNLKEKRQLEQEEMKSKRIDHILDCAFTLFAKDGIDSVTMNDIAKEAEIGVASLYRYFVTKEELAIQCATRIWKQNTAEFEELFFDDDYISKSGLEQLTVIFSIFCEMYRSNGDFFRFIYYFDSFIHRSGVTPEELQVYEGSIIDTKDIAMRAIQKGYKDGSIRKDIVESDGGSILYYTLMHSLMSLAEKLSLSGDMLNMDSEVSGAIQMKLLSQLFINSLRNPNA